jgi:hypothetical protein
MILPYLSTVNHGNVHIRVQGTSTGFQLMAPAFPRSRLSRSMISSEPSEKSYISALDLILLGVTDFGSGTNLQERCRTIENRLKFLHNDI